MAGSYQLRLTLHACEDLDVSPDLPVADLADEHPLIRKFVDMRSQSVEGQEAIQLPRSDKPVWSLHASRWRGLTWWDAKAGVVWLLGAGYHESGSPDDVYLNLKHRDQAGELFPSAEDYLALEPSPTTTQEFVAALKEEAPRLVKKALSSPESEVRATFADVLEVRVLANSDGLWIGFLMPPLISGVLPTDWYRAALAALLPDADPGDLLFHLPFPSATPPGHEHVALWPPGAPR